jgi:hypothetical protein
MSYNSGCNTLNKLLDPNINLIYDPSQTLFDHVFKMTDSTIISVQNRMSDSFYYDAYVSNNFFPYVNNRVSLQYKYQLLDMVLFHQCPPPILKKEDKTILKNSLRSTYKVFFTEKIAEAWDIQDHRSFNINYGLPKISHTIPEFTNRRSILVINTNNDPAINTLFSTIHNIFPDAFLIKDMLDSNLETSLELMSNYKIVIDLSNAYNTMCATLSGCFTITSQMYDNNIESCLVVQDFRNIPQVFTNLMNQNYALIQKDIEYLTLSYNIDSFIIQMNQLLQNIKRESFII